MKRREVHKRCGGTITLGHEVWRCDKCHEIVSADDVLNEHEIVLFDGKRPLPAATELPELVDLARYCNTPEAGTTEYALAKSFLAVLTNPDLYTAAQQALVELQKDNPS